MKYKGVARIYLNSGHIIEQPCDSVSIRMGTDGFIDGVDYGGALDKEDLIVKFLQRVTVIAVAFVMNEES